MARTIQVTVSAFGLATRFVNSGTFELKPNTKVKALLKKAGLSDPSMPLLLMIEGERVDMSRRLSGGEDLKVFPMAGGG
jgi:hypothetical protein